MFVHDGMLLKWWHEGVLRMAHIQQDECCWNPREDCDNADMMACWHPRYRLGDDPLSKNSVEDFWRQRVREAISENELVDRILSGAVSGVAAEKVGDLVNVYYIGTDGKRYLEVDEVRFATAAYYIQDLLETEDCMRLLEPYVVWLPLWLYDHSGITMSCGERCGQFSDRWDSSAIGWIYMSKDTAIKELGATEETWRIRAEEYMKSNVELYDQYIRGECYGYHLYKAVLPFTPVPENYDPDEWEEDEFGIFVGGFYGDDIEKNGIAAELPGFAEALEAGKVMTGEASIETWQTTIFKF